MIWFITTLIQGLRRNGAETSEAAEDPRLQGRTYAIPFDTVWRTALHLIDNELPRWELVSADDQEGIILATIGDAWLSPVTEITIRIGLSADAQTRVDGKASAPGRRSDLGSSSRALALFCHSLDSTLFREGSSIPAGG